MKKKLTVNALFAILSAAFILMIGCGGSGSDNPDKPEVKVVATNIVVPSSAEVTAGESLTFNLRGKTNFWPMTRSSCGRHRIRTLSARWFRSATAVRWQSASRTIS